MKLFIAQEPKEIISENDFVINSRTIVLKKEHLSKEVKVLIKYFLLLILLIFIATPDRFLCGQTSTSLIESNPKAQYYVFKKVFTGMINSGEIELYTGKIGMEFNIFDRCSDAPWYSGSEYLGDFKQPEASFANLAFEIIRLKITLVKLGYPEVAWKDVLIEFEDDVLTSYMEQLDEISDGTETGMYGIDDITVEFQKKILKSLADYRKNNDINLSRIYYEPGECGAGEIMVNIITEPKTGRFFYVPVFYYRLCEVQQINPKDLNICDRWIECIEGQLTEMAGDYNYIILWPDGTKKEGRISFTKLTDGQNLVFRK